MRIYLDNCCYNRPYDDQTQFKVTLETRAKLYIQEAIREGKYELVCSYMLEYENSRNTDTMKRKLIKDFQDRYYSYYVPIERRELLEDKISEIMEYGIKMRPMLLAQFMAHVNICLPQTSSFRNTIKAVI